MGWVLSDPVDPFNPSLPFTAAGVAGEIEHSCLMVQTQRELEKAGVAESTKEYIKTFLVFQRLGVSRELMRSM